MSLVLFVLDGDRTMLSRIETRLSDDALTWDVRPCDTLEGLDGAEIEPASSAVVVGPGEGSGQKHQRRLAEVVAHVGTAVVAWTTDDSTDFAARAARLGVQDVLVDRPGELTGLPARLLAAIERRGQVAERSSYSNRLDTRVRTLEDELLRSQDSMERALDSWQGEVDHRGKAERSMHQTRTTYRSMLDATPVLQFVFDLEADHLVYANPALVAFFGDDRKSIESRGTAYFRNRCHPDDRHKLIEVVDQLGRASGGPVRMHLRWRDSGGEYRTFLMWLVGSTKSTQGEIGRIVGSAFDVSDLQQARRELSRTNELLERLFDSLQVQVVVLDRSLKVLRANDAFLRLTDLDRPGCLGRTFSELFPDNEMEEHMVHALKTEMPRFFFERAELRLRRGKRDVTYWDWGIQPVRDETGKIGSLLVTLLDVTSRVQFRERLSIEKRRLQQLLTRLPGYVILVGADRTIRFANQRFRELFGDPEGRRCFEVQHGRGQPCDACRMKEVVDQRDIRQWEWTDSAGRTFDVWASPFIDDQGNALVLELGTDITERKRWQRRAEEIGEAERRRIGQDLHDLLGQNLTGIALMARVLADQLPEGALAESAETISEHAGQSVALTRSIARGLCPTGLDEGGLLAALQELAENSSSSFGISCRFETDLDDRHVPGQETVGAHLYSIAREAVNNAIRHGGASSIRLCLRRQPEGLQMQVIDDGDGFDTSSSSSGMGLHTMAYRAESIGGTCRIDSGLGQGTTVTISWRGDITPQQQERNHGQENS